MSDSSPPQYETEAKVGTKLKFEVVGVRVSLLTLSGNSSCIQKSSFRNENLNSLVEVRIYCK